MSSLLKIETRVNILSRIKKKREIEKNRILFSDIVNWI